MVTGLDLCAIMHSGRLHVPSFLISKIDPLSTNADLVPLGLQARIHNVGTLTRPILSDTDQYITMDRPLCIPASIQWSRSL